MFAGQTLTIHGEQYNWVSPATEGAGKHHDTYVNATNSSLTVTVSGMMGYQVASVSGASGQGTVDGHVLSEVYGDNHQSFTGTGTWQVPYNTFVQGVTFTHRDTDVTYLPEHDYYGNLASHGYDNYTAADGTAYNRSWDDRTYFSFWELTRNDTAFSGLQEIQVFGNTYTLSQARAFNESYDEWGNWGRIDTYTSVDGGTLTLRLDLYSTNLISLEVQDPKAGLVRRVEGATYNNTLSAIQWETRSAPSFTGPGLLRDGTLHVFLSGSINSAGQVVDTYRSAAGDTLTVSGPLRAFKLGAASATVASGSTTLGACTPGGGLQAAQGTTLAKASYNHTAPFFTGTSSMLEVNVNYSNVLYHFAGAFQDTAGNRTDVFVNSSVGRLTISGTTANASQGSVKLARYGTLYSGTYSSNTFSFTGVTVSISSTQTQIFGPPAFWVAGEFFEWGDYGDTHYYVGDDPIFSGELTGTPGSWVFNGTDANDHAFSGPCAVDPHGIFTFTRATGSPAIMPVLPCDTEGGVFLSPATLPAGFPPAVLMADCQRWSFLGTAAEDTAPGQTAAYYGNAETAHTSTSLLKIRTVASGSSVVTLTDYTNGTSTTGSYDAATRLFQSSGPSSSFPLPLYGIDPNDNYAFYHLTPASGSGLPASFVVDEQPWFYAGVDGAGKALYQGRYAGQQISITPATGVVSLVNPVAGGNKDGTFFKERLSIRLADDTVIFSGNNNGVTTPVMMGDSYELHTIGYDLDVVGNNISFGIMPEDASIAGALFSFSSSSSVATLKSILAKPQSRWDWSHARDASAVGTFQAMTLDETHKLRLFDVPVSPATTQNAGVVLDPAPGGVSTIRGVLRVRPGGNLDMGDFTAGGEP